MTDQERVNLTAFLVSLTDPRVRIQSAPFDHPEIFIPNGHPGDDEAVQVDYDHQAKDSLLQVRAVGAAGDPLHPITPFLGLDPQDTNPMANPDSATIYRNTTLRVQSSGVPALAGTKAGTPKLKNMECVGCSSSLSSLF